MRWGAILRPWAGGALLLAGARPPSVSATSRCATAPTSRP